MIHPDVLPTSPAAELLELLDVRRWSGGVVVTAVTVSALATCPSCGQQSRRVHSRYPRTLADLPCSGLAVQLRLQVRRFFCEAASCPRKTFAERIPEVAAPYARQTARLRALLQALGFALGGLPAARLAQQLATPVSRQTMLRRVLTAPEPARAPVAVLGLDEWAWRRARFYGTICVDLARRRVVEVLPTRSAQDVADWLATQEAVTVVSRDRGGVYADGAARGAPAAVQVADRWHLLKNLGEALEAFVVRERVRVPDPPAAVVPAAVVPAAQVQPAPPDAEAERVRRSAQATCHAEARARAREERITAVRTRSAQGVGIRPLAREFGLTRNTVRTYVRALVVSDATQSAVAPRPRRRRRLDPYLAYLWERWTAGCHNGMQLYRELQTRGYQGGVSILKALIAGWRTRLPAPPPLPHPPLTPRALRWLLVKAADDRGDAEQEQLKRLFAAAPRVQTAAALVQGFQRLLRERRPAELAAWLEAAAASGIPELASFVVGVRRDEAAVREACRSPWSQGQVEGQITRLKLLKRQMYGRAGYALLRQRVLHAA
jgi:transposase